MGTFSCLSAAAGDMDSLSSVAKGAVTPGDLPWPFGPSSGSAAGLRVVLMPFRCTPFTDRSCTSLLLSGILVKRRQNLHVTHTALFCKSRPKVLVYFSSLAALTHELLLSSVWARPVRQYASKLTTNLVHSLQEASYRESWLSLKHARLMEASGTPKGSSRAKHSMEEYLHAIVIQLSGDIKT